MTFTTAVDIAAAPGVVWSVMADVERWHEWTPSVRAIRVMGGGPLRLGARALVRQPRFPPAIWKVTELEPGHAFTWASGAPFMWVFARHLIEPIDDGARVTLVLHYDGFAGRLLARMTRDITHRYLRYEAEGLKRRSEQLAGR
jgi:ribosome-associated toxin RatA of RatAB toxin-antitoxin module